MSDGKDDRREDSIKEKIHLWERIDGTREVDIDKNWESNVYVFKEKSYLVTVLRNTTCKGRAGPHNPSIIEVLLLSE